MNNLIEGINKLSTTWSTEHEDLQQSYKNLSSNFYPFSFQVSGKQTSTVKAQISIATPPGDAGMKVTASGVSNVNDSQPLPSSFTATMTSEKVQSTTQVHKESSSSSGNFARAEKGASSSVKRHRAPIPIVRLPPSQSPVRLPIFSSEPRNFQSETSSLSNKKIDVEGDFTRFLKTALPSANSNTRKTVIIPVEEPSPAPSMAGAQNETAARKPVAVERPKPTFDSMPSGSWETASESEPDKEASSSDSSESAGPSTSRRFKGSGRGGSEPPTFSDISDMMKRAGII